MIETQLRENTTALREATRAINRFAEILAEIKAQAANTGALAKLEESRKPGLVKDSTVVTEINVLNEPKETPAADEISDNKIREIAVMITKHFKDVTEGRNAVIKLRDHVRDGARSVLELNQIQRAEFISIAKGKGWIDV